MDKMKTSTIKPEERYFFMWLLTFIGGYSNGYSFLTRDGAFVSFQTGNIAKIGLSISMADHAMLVSAIIPFCGALLGAVLGQISKSVLSKRSPTFWHKTALFIEMAALFVVGLIPSSCPNNLVVFFMATTMMFQLSTFRSLEGSVHNTTIETGNLRTFGQHFGEFILKRDLQSFRKSARYFMVFAAFPLGVAIGSLISGITDIHAIWVCCPILLFLISSLQKSPALNITTISPNF